VTSKYTLPLTRRDILCLRLDLVGLREAAHVVLDLAPVPQELNICTVHQHSTLLLQLDVLITSQGCETPVLADDDLLATGELVHGSSKGLDGSSSVGVSGSDRHEDLANVDTSDRAVRLTPGTSHSSLKSIGTSAGQHLVDSDHMVWVGSDSKVETFLSRDLDKILVGADTGGFKRFGTQLFVLVGDHMNAEGEFVDIGTLSSKIKDTDLRVRYTTVEARLWVRLVLAISVASRRSSGHFDGSLL